MCEAERAECCPRFNSNIAWCLVRVKTSLHYETLDYLMVIDKVSLYIATDCTRFTSVLARYARSVCAVHTYYSCNKSEREARAGAREPVILRFVTPHMGGSRRERYSIWLLRFMSNFKEMILRILHRVIKDTEALLTGQEAMESTLATFYIISMYCTPL